MRLLYQLGRLWTLLLGAALLALLVGLAIAFLGGSTTPLLESVAPADGAESVPLTTTIQLQFSTAMNRRSVEGALQLDPPVAGSWRWSDDDRVAVFVPAEELRPSTSYMLQLRGSQSRRLRALGPQPVVGFTTVEAPVVTFLWPPSGGLLQQDVPLVARFSIPMVPPEAVGGRAEGALDSLLTLEARWVDSRTLLADTAAELEPGRSYTITFGALRDVHGTPLVAQPSWRVVARPPQLLRHTPADAGSLAPSDPLVLHFAQPVAPALIAGALTLSPTVALSAVDGLTPTSVVTLTPAVPLQSGVSYTAALAIGDAPAERWSFAVRPRALVLASQPGAGQPMRPDEELRLVFSSPPDVPSLEQSLTITPTVEELALAVTGSELHIRAAFAPATAYTLTLAGAQEFVLPFSTSQVAPELAFDGPLIVDAGSTPQLPLSWREVAPPDLALYRLDRAQLLDLLSRPASLQPESEPLRRWAADASPEQLVLADAEGGPLSPGAYLVQARSGRLEAQLLVVVSRYHLALSASGPLLTAWAVDRTTGGPVADLPVLLFQQGTPLRSGATDARGLWSVLLDQEQQLLAFGGTADDPAVAWYAPDLARTSGRLLVLLDQLQAQPGSSVRLLAAGAPPAAQARIVLGDAAAIWVADADAQGVISATLPLPADLAPGAYALTVSAGDAAGTSELLVRDAPAVGRELLLLPSRRLVTGGQLSAEVLALEDGLPLARQELSWRLALLRGAVPEPRSGGTLQLSTAGSATLTITTPPVERPTLALLEVTLPDGTSAATSLLLLPSAQIALEPSAMLVEAGAPITLAVQVRGAFGQPLPDQLVQIVPQLQVLERAEVRTTALAPLRLTTDDSGRASVVWRPSAPGLVLLRASNGEAFDTADLWVTRQGFRNWPITSTELQLVTEQPPAPGAPLQALPLTTGQPISAVLSVLAEGGADVTALALQAGVPLSATLPISQSAPAALLLLERTPEGLALHGAALEPAGAAAPVLEIQLPDQPGPSQPLSITLGLRAAGGVPLTGTALLALDAGGDAHPLLLGPLAMDAGPTSVPLPPLPASGGWLIRAVAWDSQLQPAPAFAVLELPAPPVAVLAVPPLLRLGDVVSATVQLSGVADVALIAGSALALLNPGAPAPVDGGSAWSLLARAPDTAPVLVVADGATLDQRTLAVEGRIRPVGVGGGGLGSNFTPALPSAAGPDAQLMVAAGSPAALVELGYEQLATSPPFDVAAAAALLRAAPADAALLERLLALQNADGGWGWWRGQPSSDAATWLALLALTPLDDPAAQAAVERAQVLLSTRLLRPASREQQALLLLALAESGRPDAAAASALLSHEQRLSLSGRALLALALERSAVDDQARLVLARLLAEQQPAGLDAEERALLLLALRRIDPSSALVDPWSAELLALRRGPGWGTSSETALALLALHPTGRASAAPEVTLRLNGEIVGRGAPLLASLPLADLPLTPTLTIAGMGKLAYVWWVEDLLPQEREGPLLLRTYLDPATRQPIAGPLRVGQELLVQLTVIAPDGLVRPELHDPLPPGALARDLPEEEGLMAAVHRSTVLLLTEQLPPGVYQREYRMLLTLPGLVTVPPPQLAARGGVWATGDAVQLEIQP